MSAKTVIGWEILRVFNSASLSGGYDAIGTPLLYPTYKIKMVNLSTVNVTISRDAINDIDILPSNGFWLYDAGIWFPQGSLPAIAAGSQFYLKGTAGTGNIYLVAQHIKQ